MRYYLGPYIWDTTDPLFNFWRPPAGVISCVDLRSSPQRGSTPIPQGVGFFTVPDAVTLTSDYRLFATGDMRSALPREADRGVFASMLGLARVDGDTMTDWLWDVLSNRADPTGLTGAKPLMPTHRRMLELQVWGHSLIRSIPFDLASAHGLKCRAVIQEDYRRIRSLALDGNTRDPEIYRRVLDALGEKHRVSDPENYFIPADLPKETRLPHATTITDAFTDTNGTSLDAHTTGGGWNWVENASTWEIQGNAATCTVGGGGNIAFANTDLSSDDHYSQITATTVGSDTGVVTRVAAETDAYLGRFTTSNQIYVRDTNYSLIATNAGSVADGDIFKMESDGSTHTFYKNGSSVLSVGDTVNTGQLKCGIATLGDGVSRLDDFVAADLAAGGVAGNIAWITA